MRIIKIVFVSLLLLALGYSTVHNRANLNSHNKMESHRVDGEKCIQKGGHICGNVFQDCCKEGCYKVIPFIGPEKCLNDKVLEIPEQYCEDVCKAKNGILCSNVFQDPQCCPQASCNKGLMSKCDQKAKINVTGCYQKNIMDTLSGLVQNINLNQLS